jgi:23S rRNA pseudouridine1911/1915/1917 synthase
MTPHLIMITRAESGRTVADLLRRRLRLSWSQARRLVQERRVRLAGSVCLDAACRVKSGQRLEVLPGEASAKGPRTARSGHAAEGRPPGKKRRREKQTTSVRLPEGVPEPVLCYADAQVIVVDKPAGLTTMRHAAEAAEFGARGRRFLPPTLADLLPALLARTYPERRPTPILPIHRLDKETSGLVVFARTPGAASNLGKQFRVHTIDRVYLALVRGQAVSQRIESYLVDDRGDGRRGSTANHAAGKHAVTAVRVVEDLGDYTLVECRLETGRTHQVRIHLGEQGTPLCGERVYDRPLHGAPVPDGSGAARPMLHAVHLGFEHPQTGARMAWDTPLPEDMQALLARWRRKAGKGTQQDQDY